MKPETTSSTGKLTSPVTDTVDRQTLFLANRPVFTLAIQIKSITERIWTGTDQEILQIRFMYIKAHEAIFVVSISDNDNADTGANQSCLNR